MMHEPLPLICSIGEVLVDLFPEERKIGGAPFNFIFHLHHLGFPTKFITRLGEDPYGEYILAFLKAQKMDLSEVQKDAIHPTGIVHVHMNPDGSHSFTSQNNASQDYLCVPSNFNDGKVNPKLLFFGTYGLRHPVARESHRKILEAKKGRSLLFCDINIRPPWVSKEAVEMVFQFCDVLKISDEDLEMLRPIFPDWPIDSKKAVESLCIRHAIPHCFLTLGNKGSAFFNGESWVSNPAVSVSVANSVGAGDAFSAIVVSGLVLGWEPAIILQRASLFAASVCGETSAIPKEPSFYNSFKAWFT